MTAEQLDELVRQIGDELLTRLGTSPSQAPAPAPANGPSCGCSHPATTPAAGGASASPDRLELAGLPADLDDAALVARCNQARTAGVHSVWTGVGRTALVRRTLAGSKTRTGALIGHPYGDGCTQTLLTEAETALMVGADELDVMAPLAALRSGRLDEAYALLRGVAALGAPARLTIEPGLLGEDATLTAAAIAKLGGASALRISNGVADPHGASPEAVSLLRKALGPGSVLIASGAAPAPERLAALFAAGATRFAGPV